MTTQVQVTNTNFLVVEDNPYDLHALNRSLKRNFADWTVYGASSLHHMENVIAHTFPAIGIVDYHLPDANGLEVIDTIKQTLGEIPVIVVTGGIEATEAAKALKLGAFDYVEKDNDGIYLQKITESVQAILAQPQYVQLAADQYRELLFSNALLVHRNMPLALAEKSRTIIETICQHYPQHRGGVLYRYESNGARRMVSAYSATDLQSTDCLTPYRIEFTLDGVHAGQLVLFKPQDAQSLSKQNFEIVQREFSNLLQQAADIEELQKRASHDALTGALNRHMLLPRLDVELSRTRRTDNPLSVLMLDIDHFKSVNDRFGHVVGDRVLTEFAAVVRENLRIADTFVRYGGEEFVVLLPETEGTHAAMIAERIRRAVEAYTFETNVPHPFSVTVSIGYVTSLEGNDPPMRLIAAADSALYAAKSDGRNQIKLGEVCL